MRDDALERLSKKLNAGNSNGGITRSNLYPKGAEAPSAWHDEKQSSSEPLPMSKKRRLSPFELLFTGSAIFFVFAIIGASALFFSGNNTVSTKNVDVQLSGPAAIAGGGTLSLQVVVTNRNAVPIQLADLIVEFPPGTRSEADISVAIPRTRISLGTIQPGASVNRTIKVVLFGTAGTESPITASVEYRVPSSNAVFVSESIYTARISQSPATISVDAQKEVVSGQATVITLTVTSNAPQVLKDMLLVATYPPGFSFQGATPVPASGSTAWNLGDIEPGGIRTISIRGTFTGEDGDLRALTFMVGNKKTDSSVEITAPLATASADLTVTKPFISARIALGGSVADQHTIARGAGVSGQIQWTNNLPVSVQNLSIELKMNGQILDRASVRAPSGFFSSSNSTIVWDRTTNESFASVAPGASGTLSFSFMTLPVASGNFKNPQVDFSVSIRGNRASEGNVPDAVSSSVSTKALVATNLGLSAKLSRTAGPAQPKADTETAYAVSWNVSNSANALANVAVTASIPNYVRFIGAVSPANQNVSFDANQRIITWAVGSLGAGEGKTVSFQIGITPSVSQVGESPTVISSQRVAGFDRFVQDNVEATANPLTTQNDPSAGNQGAVAP